MPVARHHCHHLSLNSITGAILWYDPIQNFQITTSAAAKDGVWLHSTIYELQQLSNDSDFNNFIGYCPTFALRSLNIKKEYNPTT